MEACHRWISSHESQASGSTNTLFMKRLKLILIIVGSLAALVLLAVILAFTPAVQTWAVRKAVAGQPGMTIAIGRVAAGLSSADVSDVRVEKDGTVIVIKQVTAAYSATDYIFGHKINVASANARGVEVDTRKAKPTAAPVTPAQAAAAPFAGILNAIRLPGETRVGTINADGRVLLPNNQSIAFTVEGGGIAPGATGRVGWKVDFADATKDAPLAAAHTTGEAKIHSTTDLRVDNVAVTGEVTAIGPKLPADKIQLDLKLEQPAANAGEKLSAHVSLVRAGASAPEPLLSTEAAYAAGQPTFAGTWDLAVRSEQLAAMMAGLGLPEVALNGKGQYTYNLSTSAATANGDVKGTVTHLEKLNPGLANLGALQLNTSFDAGSTKDAAQLNKLSLDVAAGDRKFLAVAAQQKVSFNFASKKVGMEKPASELLRITITSVPVAWAQPFLPNMTVTSGDIGGVFVAEADADGSHVKLRAVEPFAMRAVTLMQGQQMMLDHVTVTITPHIDYSAEKILADIEKLDVSTPAGDAIGGKLNAEIVPKPNQKPAITFSADLQGKSQTLHNGVLPPDVGVIKLTINTRGHFENNLMQLSALTVQADRNPNPLAGVQVLQPLTINLDSMRVQAQNPAAPAARVSWGPITLAWAQRFVPDSQFFGLLNAGKVEVTVAGGDTLSVKATDPVSARNISATINQQQLLSNVDFSTDLAATWNGTMLTADIKQLAVKQGTASLVAGSLNAEVTPPKNAQDPNAVMQVKAKGQLDIDFAGVATQPLLIGKFALTKGGVTAKFDTNLLKTAATLQKGTVLKVAISAHDLVAQPDKKQPPVPLGTVDVSLDASFDTDSSGTVHIPLTVTKDGRKSDLLIDGKAGVKPGDISFNGKLSSMQLIVEDLQGLSAIQPLQPTANEVAKAPAPAAKPATPVATAPKAPATTPVAAATPAAAGVAPVTPVWAGFGGRLDIDLKAVKQSGQDTVNNIKGAITITPAQLAVENLSGQMADNIFRFGATLGFDPKQAKHYALNSSVEVPKFDVGAYLKKTNPKEPPAIETVVSVNANIQSAAPDVGYLADYATGVFNFKGSKGVFRGLNKKAETTSTVASVGSVAASALGGLLGGAGKSIANGAATALNVVSDLAAQLKDIQFDGMTTQAERVADGSIVIKSFDMVAPNVRLTATGRLDHKPGIAFGASPLTLKAQLSAKDKVANLLNEARQLSGKTDEKGYYLMATPFTVGGTLDKPDMSEFWKTLASNTAGGFLR